MSLAASAGVTDGWTGAPVLLDAWRRWEGAIDCALSGRVWSAGELRAASSAAVARLASLGLKTGDPVLFMVANSAAFPVGLMALLEIGCNPLLTHAGSTEPTLRRLVAEFGIRHILHDFVDGVSGLPPAAFAEASRIEMGSLSIAVLRNDAPVAAIPVAGTGVILHPTSGTYGAAKYCVRNQTVAVAEGTNYVTSIAPYTRARVTVTTPLTHAFAYGFGLVSALITHSTLALDVSFNPKRILREETERPSDILAVVPPMVRRLAELARGETNPAMARHVFYAGAPVDLAVAQMFETAFGRSLFAILGTTETGAIATSFSPEGKLAGVGRPLRNVAIDLVGRSETDGLGPGVGELRVRSPSMMQGYVGGRSIAATDFFPTGDIGRIDADGCLHLIGRIRDIINLGGMKVDPAEVEAVLMSHPSVVDAAVYPGLRAGAEFVQAAVAGTEIDVAELRRHCLAQLDPHKVPATIHIVTKLPRTPSGKCLKVECPGYPRELLQGNPPAVSAAR